MRQSSVSDVVASTAELGVLVACGRVSLDGDAARRLAERLRAGVAWESLLRAAEAHGMVPLVARHLTGETAKEVRGLVPAAVVAALRARALETAARNLALARALAGVLDVLGGAGVPALPFKGPLVAAGVYGDLTLRPFGDLDVAVPEAALRAARRALVAAGYQSAYGGGEAHDLSLLRAHGHVTLERGGVPVELHWRFAPGCYPSVPLGDALARARAVRVAGRPMPSLGPEDLLVTLCVHGGKHVWGRLEWACGVAELLRRGAVDVAAALRLADALGARRLVRLGLRVAHEVLGAPLLDGVAAAVAGDAVVGRLAGEVYARWRATGPGGEGAWEDLGFHLRAQDRVLGRARYLYDLTMRPTPAEWERVRLPGALVGLYRVVRPLRLLGRGLRAGGRVRRVPAER